MKKFIKWLAKVFNADITVTKYVTVEKEKVVALGGTIDGDVTVKGNLVVNGWVYCHGGLSCLGACDEKEILKMKGK